MASTTASPPTCWRSTGSLTSPGCGAFTLNSIARKRAVARSGQLLAYARYLRAPPLQGSPVGPCDVARRQLPLVHRHVLPARRKREDFKAPVSVPPYGWVGYVSTIERYPIGP